jgi:putative FmdB family regulatory protein
MPLYVYICPKCHQQFDTLSKVNQEEAPCPNCGSTAKRSHAIRQAPTVIYKGDGFYVTDN